MKAIPYSVTKLARAAALLMTVGLFTIGSLPASGQAFPGAAHWVVHFAAYALIAGTFGLGWPLRHAVQIGAFVAAIGAIHEVTEIVTHSHPLEIADIAVNAIGAATGALIQRAFKGGNAQ